MSFADDIRKYESTHKYKSLEVAGHKAEYLLCGNPDSQKTLVYLVGGSGRSVIWLNHVKAMEDTYRILVMEYPMDISEVEELVTFIAGLMDALKIPKAIFIGASFGGYLCQLLARRFPEKTEGICLYATSSLSEQGIENLKKQYKSMGVLLWMIRHFPSYKFLNKLMLKATFKTVDSKESEESRAYIRDLFTWVYSGYTREFDAHLTGLIVDVSNIKPCRAEDFTYLGKNILAILPLEDKAFTPEMQQDLLDMMPQAHVVRIKGGHTATLYKVDEFVKETREFLEQI